MKKSSTKSYPGVFLGLLSITLAIYFLFLSIGMMNFKDMSWYMLFLTGIVLMLSGLLLIKLGSFKRARAFIKAVLDSLDNIPFG